MSECAYFGCTATVGLEEITTPDGTRDELCGYHADKVTTADGYEKTAANTQGTDHE
jgi:hypothetical protein